jgi:hypothetical protein
MRAESYRVAGETLTDPAHLFKVKVRRDTLRDAKKCINGPMVGNVGRRGIVHGPVVASGRCQRCLDVKRGS